MTHPTEPSYLIFNADDFGASTGVNRGIADAHAKGVVTSTSFMVLGRAAEDAVAMSGDLPGLAIGLHWDTCGEDEWQLDLDDPKAIRDEFAKQLDLFERFFGRLPTHVDSHRHAHLEEHVMPIIRELVEPLGVPLRGDGKVRFVGGFYAQWEWKVTDLDHVSVAYLTKMLREEVKPGWTEFSCHPGYVSPDYQAVYLQEREAEVATLVDSRIRAEIDALGIRLVSYADHASQASSPI